MIALFIGAAILYLMSQDRTVNRIKEALDQWETEVDEDRTEADFRAELAEFLRDDDCYLIEESGLRRGRRDIWIKGCRLRYRGCHRAETEFEFSE